jgi:hypothetical protein
MMLIFLSSFLFSGMVSAQCPNGGTLTIDGNSCDWSDLSGYPISTHIRDRFGNGVDDQFTEGTKDYFTAAASTWKIGQTKPKNDIANAAVVLDGCLLYFAGDRTKVSGDAQIGFWFYLGGTAPRVLKVSPDSSGDFYPEHALGDLLILSDFTGGGRTGTVTIYTWVGTGGAYGNGTLDLATNVTGVVAINNDFPADIPAGWDYPSAQYPVNAFYEGRVNLCELEDVNGNPINFCFSSFLLEARSSQELTASLDDYVAGAFNVVPKVSINNQSVCSGQSATFTATVTGGIAPITYSFNGGPFTASNTFTINPATTSGTVTVVAKGGGTTACESEVATGTLEVIPSPVALVLTGSAICVSNPGTGTVSSTTSQVGVSYQLKDGANANVQTAKTGTGSALTWTGLAVGSNYHVVSTGAAPTNCPGGSNNVSITEVANPVALVLTGSSICATNPGTGTVSSTTSQVGVSYQLQDGTNTNVQAAKAGTGAGLTWTGLPAGANYHVVSTGAAPTNCPGGSNNVSVTEVANPVALVLTGSAICASNPGTGTVSSSTSQVGVSYQLQDGANVNVQAAKAGTGSGLAWTGLTAGTNYHVVSTGAAPTNCPGGSNNVNVTEVANPVALVLTGSAICASNPGTGTVSSSTSQVGVSYQLQDGANVNVQAAKAGTGAGLTWTGLSAGANYHVVSTGAAPTNCPGGSNNVNVTEVANPVALVLTGSAICASNPGTGTVSSSTSQVGVSYQLQDGTNTNVQAAKAGTGAGLTWTGLAVGTNYHVVSTGAAPTNCPGSSNNVNVTAIANPVDLVLTGSAICASNPGTGTVSSSTSQAGVSYQLQDGANVNVQAAKAGTGSGLTWTGLAAGTGYHVVSLVGTCPGGSNSVNITTVANPVALVLTGSAICASNPGTGTVSSTTSQVGVSYQLQDGANVNVQAAKAGTGAALTWTGLAVGSNYHVVSTGAAPTNCPGGSNNVNVTEVANPVALVLTGSAICADAPNTGTVTSTTSQVGVSYQLQNGANTNIQAAKAGTGAALSWTGLAAGDGYHVVSVGAAPTNCPGGSNSVNVASKPVPTTLASNSSPICVGGTFTVSASNSLAGAAFSWTGPNSFTSAVQNPPAFTNATLAMAGIYTVTVSLNGCSSQSATTVSIVENPIIYVPVASPFCAGNPSKGSVTLPGSQLTVNYTLLNDAALPVAGQPVKAGTGGALTWTGLDAGGYLVQATGSGPTNCANLTTPAIVVENPLPSPVADNNEVCLGDCVTLTATPAGGVWSGAGVSGTQFCSAGLSAGPHTVTYTVTNTITGCQNSDDAVITVKNCAAQICTYTQGYYGNLNGTSCDGTNGGLSTTALITQSLGNLGGTLTAGITGHSVYVMNNSTDITCLINKMPGGGASKELQAVDYSICSLPAAYLKNGRINNVLLSQTLALGLNVGITKPSTLGSFALQAGVLATAKPDGGCGSNIPLTRVCNYNVEAPYQLLSVTNEYTYRTISTAIYNAITPKTVSGLLDLANNALANTDGISGSENGVSLSEIAGAVGAINEVFDECRIFIGWNVAPCASSNAPASFSRINTKAAVTDAPESLAKVSVTAYPNPYTDKVRFEITSTVSGKGTLEVYNMAGQKLNTVYTGQVFSGKGQVIEYKVNRANRTNMIYILKVGGQQVVGKLMNVD